MTSLLVWAGVDSRDVTSLNMVADSRITFSNGDVWDSAMKVFAATTHPLILGYVGDVVFPLVTLPGVLARADAGIYGSEAHNVLGSVIADIRNAWRTYPVGHRHNTTVLVGFRRGAGMRSEFELRRLNGLAGSGDMHESSRPMPDRSGFVLIQGSGAKAVQEENEQWQQTEAGGTSRAAYAAFVDSLRIGADPLSGGAPQLASIWRDDRPARTIPVVFEDRRYLLGTELFGNALLTGLGEWRGPLFERMDGQSKRLLAGAQPHLRPGEGVGPL